MSEPNQVEVTRRVVVEKRSDRLTQWLIWGAVALFLMLVALAVYGFVSGAFTNTTPRTAEEYELAYTAEAIASNPTDGTAYARRAEALYKLGRVEDALEVLDQGERAIGEEIPSILFVLRTRAMLLNQEERFAEAEEVGVRAMDLSDIYIKGQIEANTAKGLVSAPGSIDARATVDIALQYARAMVMQEKWDKAIELYNYALYWEPTAADILSLRGWAYIGVGAETSATLDFNEALKYLPDDPSALAGLAEIEAK